MKIIKKILMSKYFLLYIILLLNFQVIGQNLVLNGDFEQFSSCPPSISCLDSALFWFTPSEGTSDYFHQCADPWFAGVPVNFLMEGGSFQVPHSGIAYGGIYLKHDIQSNYREYMQTPLFSTLLPNVTYHFEMFVSLATRCENSSNSIHCYFSDTLIQGILNDNNLPYIPQLINMTTNYPDTTNWLILSGNYVAQGGENYLIIGNFNTDNNTSSVPAAGFGWDGIYVYVDDVSLTPLTSLNNSDQTENFQLYPNPFENKLMIKGVSSEDAEIRILNSAMMEMKRIKYISNASIDVGDLKHGIYFYELRNQYTIAYGKLIKLAQK